MVSRTDEVELLSEKYQKIKPDDFRANPDDLADKFNHNFTLARKHNHQDSYSEPIEIEKYIEKISKGSREWVAGKDGSFKHAIRIHEEAIFLNIWMVDGGEEVLINPSIRLDKAGVYHISVSKKMDLKIVYL